MAAHDYVSFFKPAWLETVSESCALEISSCRRIVTHFMTPPPGTRQKRISPRTMVMHNYASWPTDHRPRILHLNCHRQQSDDPLLPLAIDLGG